MSLTAFEFVVVVLAAYRGTRALTRDSITEGLRARWIVWCSQGGAVRQKLADLVECPFCAGAWLSWITYAVAVLTLGRWDGTPTLLHAVIAWGVAGGQALLSAVDERLGDT